jgi:hypothetical protein
MITIQPAKTQFNGIPFHYCFLPNCLATCFTGIQGDQTEPSSVIFRQEHEALVLHRATRCIVNQMIAAPPD